MPIGNITQTMSTISPPPHRGVDVQAVFVNKQEDFQDHLADITIDELNTLKDQLNTRIGEINSTTTTMNEYATSASTSASTATTKAGEASTSASGALTSRNQAETFNNSASTSASTATTKASEASASALSASTSASTATTKASEASVSASNASTSAANASTSASAASVSASTSTTKASEASASAATTLGYKNDVSAMKLAVETIYDTFDDRFLGTKIVDPTLDNDGNALLDGAMYFNTSSNAMKVYDVGTTTWYAIPQIYLSALLDVQLTSITSGNILRWNGTKWINYALSKADVGLNLADNTADNTKNVLSATKLTTARTINGVAFDGSANITTYDSTKVTKVTSTNNAIVRFNGTAGEVQNSLVTINENGTLLVKSPTGGIGYGTGAGGTVTQLTSKSTEVTLNKPTGTIITHDSLIAANKYVTFLVYNSNFSITDSVVFNNDRTQCYNISASAITDGYFYITIQNFTNTATAYSITINFSIIKGANS